MRKIQKEEYLKAAAAMVEKQAVGNLEIGIPVDPDVAEYMGAFEETAISLDDIVVDVESDDEV